MPCMLTNIPVSLVDLPVAPAEAPSHIRTTLTVLGVPVTVLLHDFSIEGDALDAEGTLYPEQSAQCHLVVKLDTWNGTEPSDLMVEDHETSLRFCIEASASFCVLPILDICFLDARLTADGNWEWFLSCGGEGICDFCGEESPQQCT
jgi:hypothetical protein